MKLLRVKVTSADTCGGLLDDLDLWVRDYPVDTNAFEPLCLIGPNGSGKSQFLQVLAEMFQAAFHACVGAEERVEGNPRLEFEIEYLIRPEGAAEDKHVRIDRTADANGKFTLSIQTLIADEWIAHSPESREALSVLPSRVVGYTSGENETLSLPFLISRSGYADEVGRRALYETDQLEPVPETRLMLIDYGTHLEVLVANLLLGSSEQLVALLSEARLEALNSFRCVIQFAHSAAPKVSGRLRAPRRKRIQLTAQLESFLEQFQRCATCFDYDPKTERYTFDFLVQTATKDAFRAFWANTLELFSAFHKFAMLNDLVIPKPTRERFRTDTKLRRFASRLAEPQDEEKVFRFESVTFAPKGGGDVVDYVSLSDGEHQLTQVLGMFAMISFPNVLFLLDEPESHSNPQWRVKFMSRILDIPSPTAPRREESDARHQDCLLTTHTPFVPSDMPRERVLIFGRDSEGIAVRRPDIETYGTTFDEILEECFEVRPPISQEARTELAELMKSDSPDEIEAAMPRLGFSVEKALLADRLEQLTKTDERA